MTRILKLGCAGTCAVGAAVLYAMGLAARGGKPELMWAAGGLTVSSLVMAKQAVFGKKE